MQNSTNGLMTLSHKRKAKRAIGKMDKNARKWLGVAASARAAQMMGAGNSGNKFGGGGGGKFGTGSFMLAG